VLFGSSATLTPAAPFAKKSTVSLVLMCPSTLMQLKLSSTAVRSIDWAVAGEREASVNTTHSMVAIFGPIMAAPLAIPQTCTAWPEIVTVRPASLCRVR